jgi:predicted transglutaminase-like cysteine proteinase
MRIPFEYILFKRQPAPDRTAIIARINALVNHLPAHAGDPAAGDAWLIVPENGAWCHDYAVTKQWLLAAFGIQSKLCECTLPGAGPHDPDHMVLLVDEVALDNLTPVIGPMRYRVIWTEGDGPEAGEA